MRHRNKLKMLIVFGTRPEAIKLAPVVLEARRRTWAAPIVCVTAQHRQMLDQMLDVFGIKPDIDLAIMTHRQTLHAITSRILTRLQRVLSETQPHLLIVQGDTTTTFAASLAAFYERIPVAHVEAGLRTWRKEEPFPEELNRKLADSLADYYFPATEDNRLNLLKEGVDPARVFVVGNTVVDALIHILKASRRKNCPGLPNISPSRRLIVVTAHRRESFGEPLKNICTAIKRISELAEDVEIVYPVHLNPNVLKPVREYLGNSERIHLLPPLDYVTFVELLRRSHLILTDSGGVQEEAPSLKKPVIVMREVTERPEGVTAGFVKVVGTSVNAIVESTRKLLDDPTVHTRLKLIPNPYGDGNSAQRILTIISRHRSELMKNS
jgi:UDP-N-acetylglucosamine 2-epimerase (non-hydrolysing)